MFRVTLTDLQRVASLRVERSIPEDDPLWAGADLELGGPVRVDLVLTRTAAGEVLATGQVIAPLVRECRRCLQRGDRSLQQPVEFFWSTADLRSNEQSADTEVGTLPPGSDEIELGEAIQEELVLAVPRYVLCEDECRGLCARCGTNLNEEPCECVTDEVDSRWDALQALNNQ